jgi:acetolactate synthase-1/3 small subunit
MRHIISVLLENEPRAVARGRPVFGTRLQHRNLTVAPTEDRRCRGMTIVTTGSDDVIEQITKHLNRLVEVVKVVDLTEGAHIERELMLIKVRAVGKEREEMKRMADIFRGRIIDVTEKTYTIELTGASGKLDAFIEGHRPHRDPRNRAHRRLRHRPRRAHPEGLMPTRWQQHAVRRHVPARSIQSERIVEF